MPNSNINDDGKKKKTLIKIKKESGKFLKSQYDKYSGIVNDKGESVDNPSETEAVRNMAKYMMKNQSDQSSSPSNVYRPEFSHSAILYNRKNKISNA